MTGPELFDPGLRGGEDVDLVWRLVEAGWDVRYVPAGVVEHDGSATAGAFLSRRAFYGSSAAPLAPPRHRAMAPLHVSAWSLAVWGLALARRPVLALAALAASVVCSPGASAGLVRDPVAVATRIAGGGTARSALPALAGLTRAWSPAFVFGLCWRRTRRAAALAPARPRARGLGGQPRGLDPVRYAALHVADDIAYGAGVWAGCARAGLGGAAGAASRGGPGCGRRGPCAGTWRGTERRRAGAPDERATPS